MLATMVVAVFPIAVVWGARAERLISSPWLCVGVTVALSLLASAAGNWYWKRRPGSGDVLFSELLLWGWLRRLRVEHQLDNTTKALGLAAPAVGHCVADDAARCDADRCDADRCDADRCDADRGPSLQVGADRRLELLTQLAHALEAHDPYVDGHSRRVARHASMIARTLGLPAGEVAQIRRAAAVHDVGKLRLPREVLMKPTALTDAEFEVIKRHSTEGAEMVDCLGDPELTAMVRHHHERLDGSGYPAGLRGTEIPLGARIIAVADTFDAITSARPYRPPARHKQAIDILVSEAGVHLDPAAVRAFVSYYSGSRVQVLWAILAAVPQRAIDWTRRIGGPSPSVTATPTAASAAATLAISAVAVLPPIGLGHLPAHAAGRHQAPLQQLSGASAAAAPIALRGTSSPRTHRPVHTTRRGVRGAAKTAHPLHRFAGGLPVIRTAPRSLRPAPRAHNRAGGGRALHGNAPVAQPQGSPGVSHPRAGGGQAGGRGGGGGGGSSSGSGGASSGRSGSG
ncbi:MAG TPA: HD-GYP domain-containing protein, partial [Solirubrobacteraceae bacterium]|nr:HD-GYP domain-containing protein [Solirubrobacteraceae bacterium]